MSVRSPSLTSSGCICSDVNTPTVRSTFYNSVYVGFQFYFQLCHFSFPYFRSIFVGHYPLLIIHFCRMSYSSIPGRQGGNTTTEFAVCAWAESQTCSDHSLTDFERSNGVGHPSWCTPVIYSDLWTDKLTMKYVPYAVPVITENLNCGIEGLGSFRVTTEIHACWNCAEQRPPYVFMSRTLKTYQLPEWSRRSQETRFNGHVGNTWWFRVATRTLARRGAGHIVYLPLLSNSPHKQFWLPAPLLLFM